MTDDLIRLTAVQAVDLLKKGQIAPGELIDAALARIERVEPTLNALPTLCPERARVAAAGADRDSLLAGLPVAIKDLNEVAGVRTTFGSPIFADNVPDHSDAMVERVEESGGVVLAKANTPEFGAGASTFNEVFGKTRNPWNTTKTVGGSSGGSAAALAAGEVWLATGSDLGGSLRIPAAFCGVVGLRPTPGRVPRGPTSRPYGQLSVEGPMGRTAEDVALLLDAMAGPHPDDPIAFDKPAASFLDATRSLAPPRRVAFSSDLGVTPVDPAVTEVCRAAATAFQDMGAAVDDAAPDFTGAVESFHTLRAIGYAISMGTLLAQHRDRLKPEVVWNIEKGMALSSADIVKAELVRSELWYRMATFFRTHDLLLCPATIVPPFDVDIRYVESCGGVDFDNYVDWLAITFVITLTGCPALSVPAGLTADGLPVGLQIVGPPMGEAKVLAAARHLDQALGLSRRLPVDPRTDRAMDQASG